jgi:hypothetical protein
MIGGLVSVFSVSSYMYFLVYEGSATKQDNLLYKTGSFLDDIWFPRY